MSRAEEIPVSPQREMETKASWSSKYTCVQARVCMYKYIYIMCVCVLYNAPQYCIMLYLFTTSFQNLKNLFLSEYTLLPIGLYSDK